MKSRLFKVFVPAVLGFICLFLAISEFTSAKGTEASEQGFFHKIKAGKDYNYLIIGDSIGRGSGAESKNATWFARFEKGIKDAYDLRGRRFSLVQSGATAFEGIIKYATEKPELGVDLVFLVFGENDRKYMDAAQFSFYYEKLIRQVKLDYPAADIFTFTESCLTNAEFAKVIEDISDRYGAAHIDMRIPFAKSGLDSEKLTKDGVHPNGQGYALYAEEILKKVEELASGDEPGTFPLPAPMHKTLGREYVPIAKPSAMEGFTKDGNGYFANEKESFLEYEFTGTMVGYTLDRMPNGGMVDVFIDGKHAAILTTWWPFKRERSIYIASTLSVGSHKIRFVHTGESSHPDGSGTSPSVFIKGIIVEKPD
ncbi:SGNH/GDSL hydrolase family protein [Neobacillus notoginsengisoli]|uniref:SGNH/GDSL hydrolase family protein n=1 Tax=Neobacillus notoginsengisoli TaxID=1578198 RepID=A0A417YXK0_9BACI|nr:SGNH/GDSL hydrolase family protein [Neobacillus notoginsengisoli]RHW42259.1 SGNH/GDSL hydrolase family protein [Neobacillus notoginsengisoli]